MKVMIGNFELDVPPTDNPFGDRYRYLRVVKETEKAYCVEMPILNSPFESKIYYEWVGKSICKVDKNGDVFVPRHIVPARLKNW